MSSQRPPQGSKLTSSPVSRGGREKENDSYSYVASPTMTPQRAQKHEASEARAKVLKERAQKAELAYEAENARRRSMGFTTDEQIRKSVEKDIRESRRAQRTPEKGVSSSPKRLVDTSSETAWSQFVKWVPWNPPSSTLLDQDGYAVPTTRPSEDPMRTPERMKSPDNDMFFTPAARISGRFSDSSRKTVTPDRAVLKSLEEDFQKKLSLEATKVGLVARKTIEGLAEMGKMKDEEAEKNWKSPTKKIRKAIPEFSGVRQSHPITRDHLEPRMSLPGTVNFKSDDEETLDGVSPLNSEIHDIPRFAIPKKTPVPASPLPKLLGAQLRAEINYVETTNRLSERLDEVQDLVNKSKAAEADANLSTMLNSIELFDHSLPPFNLTPKRRYQPKTEVSGSPMTSGSRVGTPKSTRKSNGKDRQAAYTAFCKVLAECQETTRRFVSQQKKIHELVKDPHSASADYSYEEVVETYIVELRLELLTKKNEAKEKLNSVLIDDADFITWTKEQRKELDNRIKFFSLIFLDLGRFILKYNIPAPSIPAPRKLEKIQEYEWKVSLKSDKPLTIQSPLETPIDSTVTSEPKQSPRRESNEEEHRESRDALWDESLKEPVTPSLLDEAFVGQETPKVPEQDIWDESLRDFSIVRNSLTFEQNKGTEERPKERSSTQERRDIWIESLRDSVEGSQGFEQSKETDQPKDSTEKGSPDQERYIWDKSLKEPSFVEQNLIEKTSISEEHSKRSHFNQERDIWDESLKEPLSVGLPQTQSNASDVWDQSLPESRNSSIKESFEVEEEIIHDEKTPLPDVFSGSLSSQRESEEIEIAQEAEENTPLVSPKGTEALLSSFDRAWEEEERFDEDKEVSEILVAKPPTPKTPKTPKETLEPKASGSFDLLFSPKTPSSVPTLDLSLLHSSGRPSIGVDSSLLKDDGLDDFLNRSGRKDVPRYQLNASLLNDTSMAEEQQKSPVKSSPKKEFVNEPFLKSPISPQQRTVSPIATETFKDRPQISFDLNVTEEELLDDVRKPDPVLDITISKAVIDYQKNFETEENKWNAFATNGLKMEMVKEAIEIVWEIKEQMDGIPFEKQSNWEEFTRNYEAETKFEQKDRQAMYNSEWLGVLGDVFEIAGDIFPMEHKPDYRSLYYPLCSSKVTKGKFTEICRLHLVDKKKPNFVENISRDYNWDMDPARKNAHEMVMDVHHVYLKKELFSARERLVSRESWEVSEALLNQNVVEILDVARKSLGRESSVSQIINVE